jgi:hypothetical protein
MQKYKRLLRASLRHLAELICCSLLATAIFKHVMIIIIRNLDGSIDIATGYGLDGLGSIPSRDNKFSSKAFRSAPGPTQIPVQGVGRAISSGGKAAKS